MPGAAYAGKHRLLQIESGVVGSNRNPHTVRLRDIGP